MRRRVNLWCEKCAGEGGGGMETKVAEVVARLLFCEGLLLIVFSSCFM